MLHQLKLDLSKILCKRIVSFIAIAVGAITGKWWNKKQKKQKTNLSPNINSGTVKVKVVWVEEFPNYQITELSGEGIL